ncbi:MAG: ABC transporter permease [Actinomycetota bacterium]|jgi:cell division transport system permease protein|nr:ABC transporter permease [Actinomycetota bacterium]
MGGKFGYALRETLQNLRRNLVLTGASMLTVAVSLSLVGAAFLLGYGVDNVTQRWQGGIEFEIFLNETITPEQQARIQRELDASPDVARSQFVSQAEQYELFKVLFAEQEEYIESVTADVLPPSFRVEPSIADADVISALGDRFKGEPGVKDVVFAEETVRTLLRVSGITQSVIFAVAAVLLFAAALLIFNTIRTAIFARRREIEVMKLVGATNWFIRVPFMLEGLLQGLAGASVAFAIVYLVRNAAQDAIRNVPLFDGFVVVTSQVVTTGALTLVLGAAIGAVGAGVAVTKFLDV